MKYLSQLTKNEADVIQNVLLWDEELQQAFLMAKKIFEENIDVKVEELIFETEEVMKESDEQVI